METNASKTSWKNFDMPVEKEKLKFEDCFTEDEFELIKKGYIPQQMEDKWFIYYQDNCIFFHRSWTGYCIFEIYLKKEDGKYAVSEVWRNKNTEQTSDKNNTNLLRILVKSHFHKASVREDMVNYIKNLNKKS